MSRPRVLRASADVKRPVLRPRKGLVIVRLPVRLEQLAKLTAAGYDVVLV